VAKPVPRRPGHLQPSVLSALGGHFHMSVTAAVGHAAELQACQRTQISATSRWPMRWLFWQAKASEGRLLVMDSLELPEGKTVRHMQF